MPFNSKIKWTLLINYVYILSVVYTLKQGQWCSEVQFGLIKLVDIYEH